MRLQPIENLSKTYSGDPHLGQTKLNGLLLLTIHGVLSGHQGGIKCANRRTGFIDSEGSHQSQDPKDPKHMLFCRETAFVVIYALFQGQGGITCEAIDEPRKSSKTIDKHLNSVCYGSSLSMRSFSINEPRSSVRALYATLLLIKK